MVRYDISVHTNSYNTMFRSLDEIVVGYDPTAYTTSEGEGRVVLNITVFSHPVRGTPRPFTLSVTTTDGSAGMFVVLL